MFYMKTNFNVIQRVTYIAIVKHISDRLQIKEKKFSKYRRMKWKTSMRVSFVKINVINF